MATIVQGVGSSVDVELEVLVNLWIREGPSTSYNTIAILNPGDKIQGSELHNGWYRHSRGWSYASSGSYLRVVESSAIITQNTTAETQQQEISEEDSSYQGVELFATSETSGDTLNELRGIHGLPFHHLNNTDIFLSNITSEKYDYGRKYTERIISKMPLLLLSPGKPTFLQGFTKSQKESFVSQVINNYTVDQSALEEILDVDTKDGRYYSFEFDYAEYYKYVNGMIWGTARLMGIDDLIYRDNAKYGTYDWSKYSEDPSIKGFISGSAYVPFYIESEAQISESFSNSTGESMLDSGLNKLSDLGKEMEFILGAGAGAKVDALQSENYQATMDEINSIMSPFSDPSFVMERISTGLVTVAGGGQLIFPEIWKDSQFSKSYDITVKLMSPYGDKESIFKHIFVPMYHLLGMVVPRQQGMNGYTSPYLVRGFYKGIFNVDMGIITNLTINKGGEGSWNADGLPTEMEITFTIKDLYEILTMTQYTDTTMFVKNSPMLDFMANMAGISINQPELLRRVDMWLGMEYNALTKIPSNTWSSFTNTVANKLSAVFK